jgi:transposase
MDIWKPFRVSVLKNAPNARIIFDKFHIMRHLLKALDEVRRSESKRLSGKDSLGLIEGANNKIRVQQRRGYGYREEDYLELKIVAAFLPPLPRNANINPKDSA